MRRLLGAVLLVYGLAAMPATTEESPVASIKVTTQHSLALVGGAALGATEEGMRAASLMLEALDNQDRAAARKALDTLKGLPPVAQGGEYGPLQWFCEYLLAPEDARKNMLPDDLTQAYFHFFAAHDYTNLKEFLNRHFNLKAFNDQEDPETVYNHLTFLQELLIYNNPRRLEWEQTGKILSLLQIKKGDRIADIGCGSGFYAWRLARMVGDQGHVFALDVNPEHLGFLNGIIQDKGILNISTHKAAKNDIGLREQVDVAFMSSLYNVIYCVSSEPFRQQFHQSIKAALKKGGRLIIVDNGPATMPGLPYTGPFVARELVIAQLQRYGYRLVEGRQATPQRYVLTFTNEGSETTVGGATSTEETSPFDIPVTSRNSLIHIGSLDSFDITEGGIMAAQLTLSALEENNPECAHKAIELYKTLAPKENFGGEYTALQWFCEALVAPEDERRQLMEDKLVDAYYRFFADNDYAVLKEYIKRKYKFIKRMPEDPQVGHTRRSFLEDFILFNNPKREQWECTSKIMDLLKIRKGMKIADIGCGPGYYTHRFSKLVGNEGRIYALDIKQEHLDFLDQFIRREGIRNVFTIKSQTNDTCVHDQVDLAFMCSLFHIIYGVSSEQERSEFIASIKRTLKKDGRLVIVDNGPVADALLPYHGPYIAKELIIAQLQRYGFKLERQHQIIPQRYMLVFGM